MIELAAELVEWINRLKTADRQAIGARFDRLRAKGEASGHVQEAEERLHVMMFFERERGDDITWYLTYYITPDGHRLFLTCFSEATDWSVGIRQALKKKRQSIAAGHTVEYL